MASIESKRVRVGELDIHYYRGGQGDPLVVIHGGANGAKAWMKNIRELSRKYTVYVPDLPGYGLSQSIEGDYFIPELVDFIDKFSHSLGLRNFHLVGHSLGGGIALSYALKFPYKVTKLVLVSSLCLGKEIALWVRVFANCRLCHWLWMPALIPDCRVKVFAGRGHSVYRDKLGEFSSLLTDFLG